MNIFLALLSYESNVMPSLLPFFFFFFKMSLAFKGLRHMADVLMMSFS